MRFVHARYLGLCVCLAMAGAAAAAPTIRAPPGPIKPLIRGLIAMGNITFHRQDAGIPDNSLGEIAGRPGLLGGVVVNIAWAQLEPTPGALDTAALDEALAAVRAYNRRFPELPLAVKLRVWPGPNAPAWAKSMGGPPVRIERFVGSVTDEVTVGRFWSVDYRRAWSWLQHALARKYDSEPLIREVSNSSCSSTSDESFIVSGQGISIQSMLQAGFTDQAFETCLMESPADYSGWKLTRIDFAFNPYRRIDSGRPIMDQPVTFRVMAAFRRALGERAVLTNHALQIPELPYLVPIFEQIQRFGSPIEFQTEAPNARGGLDWDAAISYGISLGASAIEIWQGQRLGGFETIAPEKLKAWSVALGGKPE